MGDNVWFLTVIFVSGCVVCACVCTSGTERTESQHCQKVGPLFIKRLFVFIIPIIFVNPYNYFSL